MLGLGLFSLCVAVALLGGPRSPVQAKRRGGVADLLYQPDMPIHPEFD